MLMSKWRRKVFLPADEVVHVQIEQSTRSTNRSIKQLAENGVPGEKIREALISQSVELIFTAHPTQVTVVPWLTCMICTVETLHSHVVVLLQRAMPRTAGCSCARFYVQILHRLSHSLLGMQAIRQTLLKKYARIRSDMDKLHNSRMSPYEKLECLDSIKSQIQGAWRTDEIRRQKPSPQVQTWI